MAALVKDHKSLLLEEKLRENCCVGDEAKVKTLLDKGVDINAANKMNGWTPLHWAAKRGHKNIVELLLKEGAVTTTTTKKGETPASLASKQEIRDLICLPDGEAVEETVSESLPIVPNYIQNPPFIYLNGDEGKDSEDNDTLPFGLGRTLRKEPDTAMTSPAKRNGECLTSPPRKTIALDVDTSNLPGNLSIYQALSNSSVQNHVLTELVLKVRVADSQEQDFIEIEVDYNNLTFDNLLDVCCRELEINRTRVRKVRKLPNTIIRKDKDVGRLQQFQEIEIVQCFD